MIISRTPLRISFAGGGSDLREYYRVHGGAVLSTSINKYIYLSMHPYFNDQKYFLKYSRSELVDSIDQIQHRIIREAFTDYGIRGVDFSSSADIPAGTGLGSSSSFTVGLINLCNAYTGKAMSRYQLAEYACAIEIERLGEPIGKQDHYAGAFGGLNFITFHTDDSIRIEPVAMGPLASEKMQRNLKLYFLGYTRAASEVLHEQRHNLQTQRRSIGAMKRMVRLALDLRIELRQGNIDALGEILHTGWMYKKELASSISNDQIEHYYERARQHGASGGKLLGAGGCGFLLFYVPESQQERLRHALADLQEFPVEFEDAGSVVFQLNPSPRLVGHETLRSERARGAASGPAGIGQAHFVPSCAGLRFEPEVHR